VFNIEETSRPKEDRTERSEGECALPNLICIHMKVLYCIL